MNKIILFGLLIIGFLVFMPSSSEASTWAGPCGPAGSCDAAAPITVKGGTILENYNLTVQGINQGGPDDTAPTVITSAGLVSGGKITADGDTSDYFPSDLQVSVCTWVSEIEDDEGTPDENEYVAGYMDCHLQDVENVKNVFFDDLVIANNGILLGQYQHINLIAGDNSIQVTEGTGGDWGYAVLAQAHAVGTVEASDDTVGVWGKSAEGKDGDNSYGIYGQGGGTGTYGVYATNTTIDSYALRASNSYYGGGAAYFGGSVDVYNGNLTVNSETHLGYNSPNGGDQNALTVYGDTTLYIDNYFKEGWCVGGGWSQVCFPDTDYQRYFKVIATDTDDNGSTTYTPITVKSSKPNKVYFGEATDSGIELCLNGTSDDECISSWATGTTGNLQSVTSSGATTNQAVTISNDLTISGNYKKLILQHSSTNQYNEIYFKSKVNTNSDYGYIRYYDDNNSYDWWGASSENSALIVGVQNDSANVYSDVVVLKSPAAVIVDSPRVCLGSDCITSWGIDSILGSGSSTEKTITVGEICIGSTCLTEAELQVLKDWIEMSAN